SSDLEKAQHFSAVRRVEMDEVVKLWVAHACNVQVRKKLCDAILLLSPEGRIVVEIQDHLGAGAQIPVNLCTGRLPEHDERKNGPQVAHRDVTRLAEVDGHEQALEAATDFGTANRVTQVRDVVSEWTEFDILARCLGASRPEE